MPPSSRKAERSEEHRTRGARLGFRVDHDTKRLVERAAALERRKLTDYCLTALAAAAEATVARHDTLVLSERDRRAFFAALVHPAKPNRRLKRAFRRERELIAP
ncbi:MAG TPA: DUF1778 domain-containing protein [Alphaproteobacteria bacterium]|nr:DUF1778 domain-containing protein [Alphaproteobacteria bacterium]